jgi:hypothetical protein
LFFALSLYDSNRRILFASIYNLSIKIGGVEMESTPYIQTDLPSDQSGLQQKLQTKLDYLADIQTAVVSGDDRKIYELLDNQKYDLKVRHQSETASNRPLAT